MLLNLVLLAATVWAGWQLRSLYLAAKARDAAMLNKKLPPAPPPPLTPLAPPAPVMAAGYSKIATETLFDKSRNPTVVIVTQPPPPPPPVPPFPALKGMMNLGDGLTAMFSERPGGRGAEVKPGEKIGQFTLVSVNEQEAVFAWNGQTFRKPVDEILDRAKSDSAESSRPVAVTEAAPPPVVKTPLGPGAQTGEATRACNVNDSTPAGSVVDGYKKVEIQTVFGKACRWEKQ